MKTTQQRHVQRIQRVIDHIYDQSASELDSAAIAEIAHVSTYHWHRIYMAVTGESAVSTLRRVRLEKVATALLRDDRPIAQIAAENGFDNLHAFNRLFSRTYGVPPGRFRAGHASRVQKREIHETAPLSIVSRFTDNGIVQDSCVSMQVGDTEVSNLPITLAEREPLRLVGMWHHGDYHEIGRVFEKVMAAAEIESWPRSETFTVGVYFDDPDVVPLESCRSFAGIPVHTDFQPSHEYDTQLVPGGLHASYLHTGPYALLPDSYHWLYREWLRESVHDARDNPCYEVYLNTPNNTPPAALQTVICLPLESSL